jgi:hypothetical protein
MKRSEMRKIRHGIGVFVIALLLGSPAQAFHKQAPTVLQLTIAGDTDLPRIPAQGRRAGPRMFTIDERSWGDLEGEILVYMPSQFAAFVREDDRVTVEGTVQRFNLAEVEQEWGWFGLNDEVEVNFVERPVLVADRIVGGDNDIAMFINVSPGADRPVGTSGGLMDLQKFANTDADDLVGELVHLDDVKVVGTAADQKNGFFIDAGGEHVFVLPASPGTMAAAGQAVAIEGVVLELPDGMDDRLKSPGDLNDDIYIYATAVRS